MTSSLTQRTPAWHAARRGKLTASNIGAALGLCPWTSRQQAYNRAMGLERFQGAFWREMLGRIPTNEFLRALLGAGNDATRWGVANEPNGILAYSAHTGNIVANTGLHVHPAASWLAGSPDGLIGTEGMLEVKCPYWKKKDGTRVHAQIPTHYYMQINLCMECGNRDWCDFISWSPEGYAVYRVTRDQTLHERMMEHYLKFFAAMQRMAKAPPPLSEAEKQSIADAVADSMAEHVNYRFWAAVDTTVSPPSPDSDEQPAKKQKCDSNFPEGEGDDE